MRAVNGDLVGEMGDGMGWVIKVRIRRKEAVVCGQIGIEGDIRRGWGRVREIKREKKGEIARNQTGFERNVRTGGSNR